MKVLTILGIIGGTAIAAFSWFMEQSECCLKAMDANHLNCFLEHSTLQHSYKPALLIYTIVYPLLAVISLLGSVPWIFLGRELNSCTS
jgi:hypothetical protein